MVSKHRSWASIGFLRIHRHGQWNEDETGVAEIQTRMGTLESSVGTGVDIWINQVMERWHEENREQSTLLREQLMEHAPVHEDVCIPTIGKTLS